MINARELGEWIEGLKDEVDSLSPAIDTRLAAAQGTTLADLFGRVWTVYSLTKAGLFC